VSAAITPEVQQTTLSFEYLLADVDRAWLADGRRLLDETGVEHAVMEADILAMVRLTDRLLLCLADGRLVIVDPLEHFQIVGTYRHTTPLIDLAAHHDAVVAVDGTGSLAGFTVSGNELRATDAGLAQTVSERARRPVR
jgi:hypothetical protein